MVKKFVFKLQTALDVRAQRLDVLKGHMAQLQQLWLASVQKREQLVKDMQHASDQRHQHGGTLALQMAQQWPTVQEQMGKAIAQCRQQENQLQQQMRQMQLQLQQAVKDHKALDTLKTQQLQTHQKTVLAVEEATLADMTQSRFGRF
jgi:flagellar export protein FliJ